MHCQLHWLQAPFDLISIILNWVDSTAFHIVKDGEDVQYESDRGIRQRCKLSPTLCLCISLYLVHNIEQDLGRDCCAEHLAGFADDTHLRWTFSTLMEAQASLQQASRVLHVLQAAGLVVSKDKTVCLLIAEGSSSMSFNRKVVASTKEAIQLSGECVLPLRRSHTYLGGIVSYEDYEWLNVRNRVHSEQAAFSRLRKHLMAKKICSVQQRLNLWRTSVIPAVMYSWTASG